jgi:hypothetical protein
MRFGDKWVNPAASDDNPNKVGYFVRTGNRYGKINPGKFYEFTDKHGGFWQVPASSVERHRAAAKPRLERSLAEEEQE